MVPMKSKQALKGVLGTLLLEGVRFNDKDKANHRLMLYIPSNSIMYKDPILVISKHKFWKRIHRIFDEINANGFHVRIQVRVYEDNWTLEKGVQNFDMLADKFVECVMQYVEEVK